MKYLVKIGFSIWRVVQRLRDYITRESKWKTDPDHAIWLRKQLFWYRDGMYLRKTEFSWLQDLRPESSSSIDISPDAALSSIQEQIHELIEMYLSPALGGYGRSGARYDAFIRDKACRILFWGEHLRKHEGHMVYDVISAARNLINKNRKCGTNEVARLIASFYIMFEKCKCKVDLKSYNIEIHKMQRFQENAYSEPLLSGIITRIYRILHKGLGHHLQGVYLHGSLSTKDYVTECSDVDILIILSREAFVDPEKIVQIRKIIIKAAYQSVLIDPLQHHGFFILCESDLKYFPVSFFPLELFQFSTILYNKEKILRFSVRDDTALRRRKFLYAAMVARSYYIRHRPPRTAFEWKTFFQIQLILPCLFLQLGGKCLYKREAIPHLRTLCPKIPWDVIETATRLRAERQYSRTGIPSIHYGISRVLSPGLLLFTARWQGKRTAAFDGMFDPEEILSQAFEYSEFLIEEAHQRKWL